MRTLLHAGSLVVLLTSCGGEVPVMPVDPQPRDVEPLVVRVLDVGFGESTVITNGASTVVIDGGGDINRFRSLVDSLQLNGSAIDAVIVSHAHSDHASGLRVLFELERNITVRHFFDNLEASTLNSLQLLRDSASARARRGELIYRNAADPCGNGSAVCTLQLAGGARLHVMRPFPGAATTDDLSIPVKLVGPDSASFSMWFAGDARYSAIDWFIDGAGYHRVPGMKVNVLKGQEHGNCRSNTPRLLQSTSPDWVTFSLEAQNGKGLIHSETRDLLRGLARPYYRTDQNGSITFVSPGTPGGGYTVSVQRGGINPAGIEDSDSGSFRCEYALGPAAAARGGYA